MINKRNSILRKQEYITGMRPVLKKRAMFSDTTENFVTPAEPNPYEEVKIRFRARIENIDEVYFVSNGIKELMLHESSDDYFDYYETRVILENRELVYYFEVRAGKIVIYFDKRGVARDINERYMFRIIAGFKTPEWSKGAVMYQLYIDRFNNGDTSSDVLTGEYRYIGEPVVHADSWESLPDNMDVRRFYGGDMQGVIDKLDYLQNLGVDVIYFNPLFVSPSNHKYDIQDYDYIDPHLGKFEYDEGELLGDATENRFATRYINRVTDKRNLEAANRMFIRMVEEIHKRGMKVILDGVFNHCGSFNRWLDRERIYENSEGYEKGAYVSESSPYRNFFKFHEENKWPYNYTYDGWWGHDTLPKLNYEGSRELYDYILNIGKKWVSAPYNVDGWRLDVAADLGHSNEFNHQFWKDFRKAVREANPNAIVLAEHYGDPSSWLNGYEWDTVMNYDAFLEPVSWFFTGMQKHSDDYRADLLGNEEAFWGAMYHHGAAFTNPSLVTAMNELSNHDHSRFLTRTNHRVGRVANLGSQAASEGINKAVLREAVMLQMTWPGAPTVYYGDEAGVCGFTDPDNRRTYPWGREDNELIEFHKEMIRIHKSYPEFIKGSIKRLEGAYNVLSYGRFNNQGSSIVIFNNNNYSVHHELATVWEVNIPKECSMSVLIETSENGYSISERFITVSAGKINLELPPVSGIVLHYSRNN